MSFTTIVKYAKAGFLDYVLSTDGRMLFRTGQVEKIKELRASNVKRRVETARAARHPNSRGLP